MTTNSSDFNFLRDFNNLKLTEPPKKSIADFIEEKRLMPPGTPFPGPVDLRLTPHVVEWMENMSPYSPIQHQVLLKAAQIAATFAIEGILGYWMSEYPTAIMYMSATQVLLEKWATKRLEPMIDSCGIRPKIIQNADETFGRKSRRTGDKTFSKLFVGGFLEMASAQAAASQRSDSIRVLVRDETEGAPKELTTGEGSWLNTSEARTKFWGNRRKITDLSTPGDADGNYIESAYKEGDQRMRFIPCPFCGKFQPLYEFPEEGNHGLRAEKKAGKIIDVYYLCEFCHDAIFDHHKYQMNLNGKWEPTAVSKAAWYRSYYINSLYSPPGTVSFKDYYLMWEKSKIGPEEEKGFLNLWAGHVYQERGSRPKLDSIHHLRGLYKSMTVPDGVLFLTAAIDVQRGSDKYQELSRDDLEIEIKEAEKKGEIKNFPRLEMEILGHGGGYRTWSIGYFRFEGRLEDIESGAWEKLTDFYNALAAQSDIHKKGKPVPTIKRSDGYNYEIPMRFIDARDGSMKDIVYSYCHRKESFHPSMGWASHKSEKQKRKSGDAESAMDRSRYKINQAGKDLYVYIISTNYYKNFIYNAAKIERLAVGQQRPRFMDHPSDYDDRYFEMLFAEEKRKDGSFHDGGRRNESLDCKSYNLAAGDAYIDMLVDLWRRVYQQKGFSLEKCRMEITKVWILKYLENVCKKKDNINN